jgi:hypothetical protein
LVYGKYSLAGRQGDNELIAADERKLTGPSRQRQALPPEHHDLGPAQLAAAVLPSAAASRSALPGARQAVGDARFLSSPWSLSRRRALFGLRPIIPGETRLSAMPVTQQVDRAPIRSNTVPHCSNTWYSL